MGERVGDMRSAEEIEELRVLAESVLAAIAAGELYASVAEVTGLQGVADTLEWAQTPD